MRKRTLSIFLFLCLFAMFLPQSASGAPDVPEQVNTVTYPAPVRDSLWYVSMQSYDQAVPAVAYNSTRDEYLITWCQLNGTLYVIYAQRYTAGGTPIGQPMEVYSNTREQIRPDVAYDPFYDQYLIVWQDRNDTVYGFYDLAGRIIDGDSINPDSHTFYIASYELASMLHPSVAFDPNARVFMTAWTEQTLTGLGISAQPLSRADSSTFDPSSWINVAYTSGDYTRTNADIAWDEANDEFVIVYQKYYGPDDEDIAVARLNSVGTVLEKDESIAASTNNETDPAIAACPGQNKLLIAWEESQSGSYREVKGRLVVGQSITWAEAVDIGIMPLVDNYLPEIACNHAGNAFIATWWEYDATLGFSAYARSVLADGDTSASVILETEVSSSIFPPRAPIAIAGGKVNYYVAWEHQLGTLAQANLYGSLLTPFQSYMPLNLSNKDTK